MYSASNEHKIIVRALLSVTKMWYFPINLFLSMKTIGFFMKTKFVEFHFFCVYSKFSPGIIFKPLLLLLSQKARRMNRGKGAQLHKPHGPLQFSPAG